MKVVIIGGGPAALSAAFELTEPGRGDHEVTILQPGWRLGGKCASGRNQALGNRIEEHGLHIWFGAYDNAIALMTRCYEELARDSQRYAFTSFENAFEGVDEAILWQRHGDDWTFKEVRFPRDPVKPPNFHSFAVRALDWAGSPLSELVEKRQAEGLDLDLESLRGDLRPLFELVGITELDELGLDATVGSAASRAQRLMADAFSDVEKDVGVDVVALADGYAEMVKGIVLKNWLGDRHIRFYLDTLDVLLAVLRGVWTDRLLVKGFDTINDLDFAKWLEAHGLELAPDPEEWPAVLRAVYCGCFAFKGGDPCKPRMAAGRALQGAIRCVLHYQGSVLHRMRGAMGDIVIAPFYEVLAKRGVEVLFFHAVNELRLDDAKGTIAEIRGVRQLELDGPYDPLFDAEYSGDDGPRTVPAWPSEPLWDRLPKVEQAVRDAPLLLEQEIDPFNGSEFCLRRRSDTDADDAADLFDVVVLAVPPNVQETICGALKKEDPGYARMLKHSKTVVTQGSQLWLERSAEELGQKFSSRSLMSTFVEPLDTYCDMAHLLPNEQWPEGERARHIAYFCGVLRIPTVPDQPSADADAERELKRFVAAHGTKLWPSATQKGGFDYDLLAPRPERPTPDGSFRDQFWRANFAAPERYVLSLPKTIQHRLRADGTRFDNLVLAGDWTVNGFDAGCLEAAVTSGLLASNAICGQPAFERIAGLNGPPGFPGLAQRRRSVDEAKSSSLLCAGPRFLWRALTGAAGVARAAGDEVVRRLNGR